MIDPLTLPYRLSLVYALDALRLEGHAEMPQAYQDAVMSVLERHPFRDGVPFKGPDPELCHAVVRVCGQWQLEPAYERLCELLYRAPQGMVSGQVASARHTLVKALVGYGSRPRTIDCFKELLKMGGATRWEALCALLAWQALGDAALAKIDIDELFRLTYSSSERLVVKHAKALLVERFNIKEPTHLNALQRHLDPEEYVGSFRPYGLILNEDMCIYYKRKLLRFLGASAPATIREHVLQRRNRKALATYLDPVIPGCLQYIDASYFGYLLCSELAAGALWRQRSDESDDAALLKALHSQRRGIQKNAYHGLLRRKEEALPALKQAMEAKPAYKPNKWPRGIQAPRDPISFVSPEERSQRLLGQIYGRQLFATQATEPGRMSALREILTLPANDATWSALCAFLNGWCRHAAFQPEIVYPYTNEHLLSWSDDLREVPSDWWDFFYEPIPRPWPIIRRIHLGGSSLFRDSFPHKKGLSERQLRAISRLFVQAAPIDRCTQLFLHSCHLTDEALREILKQPHLDSLQLLQLDFNLLGRGSLNAIAKEPRLSSLRYLSFRHNKDLILKTPKRLQEQKPDLAHLFFS